MTKSKKKSRQERQQRLAKQKGQQKRSSSIKHQIHQKLDPMVQRGYGTSKHDDKAANGGKPAQDKIYSQNTSKAYHSVSMQFAKWCQDKYHTKDLDAMRQYVPDYLRQRQMDGCAATTVYRDGAALAKLYQVTLETWHQEGVVFEKRHYSSITRGRDPEKWRGRFSEAKHQDLVEFCRACGLRRDEILTLSARDVYRDESGAVIVHVLPGKGKGGKERYVTALNDTPLRLAQAALEKGQSQVFLPAEIPQTAPIHWYRSDFARDLYQRCARDVTQLQDRELYHPRGGGMDGMLLDRDALKKVSEQLGHNRLDVVPHHYLYPRG